MGKANNTRKLILNKLAASGFDTEKKVQSLSMDDLLLIAQELNLKVTDIKVIREFQKAIKEKRTWSYYNNGIDEEEKDHGRENGNDEGSGGSEELRGTEGVHRDDDGQYFSQY